MLFSELNEENFLLFAIKNYENPQAVTREDFDKDLNHFKYIKRLLKRYKSTGELKTHLLLNHFIVIAHGLVKLFLARHQLGEVELPANFVRRVYQRHLVAALCRRGGIGQPGRSGTDNGNRFRIVGRLIFEQRFVAGTRINQTACRLAAKCMVEAGLITRNAGVNLIGAIFRRLIHKLAVSQHRARHRHQIRVAALKHFFGDMRHVDTI